MTSLSRLSCTTTQHIQASIISASILPRCLDSSPSSSARGYLSTRISNPRFIHPTSNPNRRNSTLIHPSKNFTKFTSLNSLPNYNPTRTYHNHNHTSNFHSSAIMSASELKRPLSLDEGGDTPMSGVDPERTKRARVEGEKEGEESANGEEAPIASTSSNTNAAHASTSPGGGAEAGESDSDVIIIQNSTTTTESPSKNKNETTGTKQNSRGKGKGRRADERKDGDGNNNNSKGKKKTRGRGPETRHTRNAEDALKKEKSVGGGEGEGVGEGEGGAKSVRYPKRQCALLIGFCGSGYSGMQIQPDHTRTIEGVLFNALVKVGAVSQDNADNPTKVNLARAARTDAGVHAAGNVVSLKMITAIPGVEDVVARINEELPPEIRLWGYARTQNSFNARLICESRKYTYFFPTYLLIPPKPGSGMHRVWSELASSLSIPSSTTTAASTETSSEATTTTTATEPSPSISYAFWESSASAPSTKDSDLARKRSWRIAPDQVQTLRTLAAQYIGTHNFHNFTVGRDFKDRSNNRYMRRIEVSDPVVYGETEWISVLFHGQSFMLHQRKMMAVLVLSCRMGTPPKVIDELYTQREVFVPKMPSLGLLLEEPLFDSYNQRMSVINAKLEPSDPEYRPLIDFNVHRDKINAFKDAFIYQNMRKVEDRDGLFDAWVRYIDAYAGNDLLYLNPSGTVPEVAVIKRGERRPNPFKEKKVFDTTSFPGNGIKQKLEAAEDVDMEDEEEEVLDKRHLAETEG